MGHIIWPYDMDHDQIIWALQDHIIWHIPVVFPEWPHITFLIFQGTVSHCGPMAGNAVDLSLLYSIIAGPTSDDPYSMLQPAVSIPQFTNEKLNLKIGVDWQWAEQADPVTVDYFF